MGQSVWNKYQLPWQSVISMWRRWQFDHSGETAHATFDPHGPGVARVYLPPAKPFRPSVILIAGRAGTFSTKISPAHAQLLRVFFAVIDELTFPGEEVDQALQEAIVERTLKRMEYLYPGTPRVCFRDDLFDLIPIIMAVAQGNEIPAGAYTPMTSDEYVRLSGAPQRMDVLLTPGCNLGCRNCYAWGQKAVQPGKSLTTTQWKKIIRKLWKAGVIELTFTGGEPTLRKDLPEIVYSAKRFITRVNTNGTKLTPELCEHLVRAELDAIQVTLYSSDPLVHDDLVGVPGSWQLTVKGIRNAVAAGLEVSINTPLVRLNAPGYNETLKFIQSLGVRYVTCSGLIPTGAAVLEIRTGQALTNAEMMDLMRTAVHTTGDLGLEISFTSPGWLTQEQCSELGLSFPVCGACLTNMAVDPQGIVRPCQSWLNEDELGNLLTDDWRTIWKSGRCEEIRAMPEISQGCPLAGEEVQ